MKKNEAELVDNIHADGHPPDKLKTQNMKKQKSHSPELISRPLVTRASQENDAAKIMKIIVITKEKLKNLAEHLISANTPFSLRRVPQGRAEVMPFDEKCVGAASGSAFC